MADCREEKIRSTRARSLFTRSRRALKLPSWVQSRSLYTKRRPVLVLSDNTVNCASGHTVMAQITGAVSTSWPGDVPINHMHAGLTTVSLVRMKLSTIDNRLIRRNAGKLSAADRDRVSASL